MCPVEYASPGKFRRPLPLATPVLIIVNYLNFPLRLDDVSRKINRRGDRPLPSIGSNQLCQAVINSLCLPIEVASSGVSYSNLLIMPNPCSLNCIVA